MNSLLRVEHVTISYNGKPMVEAGRDPWNRG